MTATSPESSFPSYLQDDEEILHQENSDRFKSSAVDAAAFEYDNSKKVLDTMVKFSNANESRVINEDENKLTSSNLNIYEKQRESTNIENILKIEAKVRKNLAVGIPYLEFRNDNVTQGLKEDTALNINAYNHTNLMNGICDNLDGHTEKNEENNNSLKDYVLIAPSKSIEFTNTNKNLDKHTNDLLAGYVLKNESGSDVDRTAKNMKGRKKNHESKDSGNRWNDDVRRQGSPVDASAIRLPFPNYTGTSYLPRSNFSLISHKKLDDSDYTPKSSSAAMDRVNEILTKSRESYDEYSAIWTEGSDVDPFVVTNGIHISEEIRSSLSSEKNRLMKIDKLISELPLYRNNLQRWQLPETKDIEETSRQTKHSKMSTATVLPEINRSRHLSPENTERNKHRNLTNASEHRYTSKYRSPSLVIKPTSSTVWQMPSINSNKSQIHHKNEHHVRSNQNIKKTSSRKPQIRLRKSKRGSSNNYLYHRNKRANENVMNNSSFLGRNQQHNLKTSSQREDGKLNDPILIDSAKPSITTKNQQNQQTYFISNLHANPKTNTNSFHPILKRVKKTKLTKYKPKFLSWGHESNEKLQHLSLDRGLNQTENKFKEHPKKAQKQEAGDTSKSQENLDGKIIKKTSEIKPNKEIQKDSRKPHKKPANIQRKGWELMRRCSSIGDRYCTPLVRGQPEVNMGLLSEVIMATGELCNKNRIKNKKKSVDKRYERKPMRNILPKNPTFEDKHDILKLLPEYKRRMTWQSCF